MALLPLAVLGQRVGRFGQHRPHWFGILFMVLLTVLVVAGIVTLVVWLVRSTSRSGRAPAGPPGGPAVPVGAAAGAVPSAAAPGTTLDARRILDERLARGEVDPEEYRLRREALES